MTPAARDFARWAARSGFVEDGHDSAYRGTIDDVEVRVDDGVRASGRYNVELEITIATGEPPGNVRSHKSESTPIREALRAWVTEEERVESIRVEVERVVLRLGAETPASEVEPIARHVIDVCRHARDRSAPYR